MTPSGGSSSRFSTTSPLRLALSVGILVIPGILLFFGMTAREEQILEMKRTRFLHQASSLLDRYAPLGDPGVYLARLLRETFERSDSAPEPGRELAHRISRLKRLFPGALEFAAWDASGSIIPACTDTRGYRTVLAKTWQVLRVVADQVTEVPARELPMLPQIADSINLISGFFGRFFVPVQLAWAYGIEGEYPLALVDVGKSRSYFWHRSGKHLSLLVFLSDRTVQRHEGLEKTLVTINRRNPRGWQLTIIDPRSSRVLRALESDTYGHELLTAIQRETFTGGQLHETSRLIIGSRLLMDGRYLLAWLPKNTRMPPLPQRIRNLLCRIALAYLLLFTIWKCISWRGLIAPSIQHELVLLFLLACGVPLMMLFINSTEFFETWHDSTVRRLQNQVERQFKQTDDGIVPFIENLASRLNTEITSIEQTSDKWSCPRDLFPRVASAPLISTADELYLFAEGGISFSICPGRRLSPTRRNSMTEIGAAARSLLVHGCLPSSDRDHPSAISRTQQFHKAVGLLLVKLGGFQRLTIGARRSWIYVNLIQAGPQTTDQILLIGIWSDQTVAEAFLQEVIPELRRRLPTLQIQVQPGSERGARESGQVPGHWTELIDLARRRGRVSFQNIPSRDDLLFGLAFASRTLPDLVYLAAASENGLQTDQNDLLKLFAAIGMFLLVFALSVGRGLARSFLQPLERIESMAIALQHKQFTVPTVSGSRDEFGELERTFADVTGSLSELEIARVVQESLLPNERLIRGNLSIYGRSCAVTSLGGDYFDCFALDDNRVCALLGDVAGHGVGAALMMAVAKASVFLARQHWNNPAAVLQLVHEQLFALQKKPKKLMTMLFVTLDTTTGTGRMANAGQTYPILMREDSAETKSLAGRALGVWKTADIAETDIRLAPGDQLILYTDGFIEALAKDGSQVGYDRCFTLMQTCRRDDPQEFVEVFLRAHRDVAPALQDDSTLVIISHARARSGKNP